jgi:hypothetical protein
MASTPHNLFSWQAIDESSDIFRLRVLLDGLDDHRLMRALEGERKGKRNEFPLCALWNSCLAGMIFGHETRTSLIRELRRNAELREVCGFDPLLKEKAVPGKDVYYRFFKKLAGHADLVEGIFHALVERLHELLPDLGRSLAVDAKAVPAFRKSDAEAAVGVKSDPTTGDVLRSWFGYKLHVICDATYELPLGFAVTNGAANDSPHLLPLVDELKQRHETLHDACEELSADRGYDKGKTKSSLFDEHGIDPLIPARNMSDMEPIDPSRSDTIYLSGTGEVCCKVLPFEQDENKTFARMEFRGYEKDRRTLKFRCPAAAFGLECKNQEACRRLLPDQGFGRTIRVPLERDRRRILPVYPHGTRFEKAYKKRTSIERFFFRLDHFYGFERNSAVGLKQMRLRTAMGFIGVLATAVGWIAAKEPGKMRSLFQAA